MVEKSGERFHLTVRFVSQQRLPEVVNGGQIPDVYEINKPDSKRSWRGKCGEVYTKSVYDFQALRAFFEARPHFTLISYDGSYQVSNLNLVPDLQKVLEDDCFGVPLLRCSVLA